MRSEKLESLLEEARRIQQSILPRTFPEVGDYEVYALTAPAEAVGGDFYDFLKLGPDGFGAAIADASGHGLLAALLVRDVYVGLRMGIGGDLKIARVIERLNRILNKSRLSTKFVSLFYGEFEANGEIIYANAGHPGPLHLHARTRSFSEMESTGMVLGPSPNAPYSAPGREDGAGRPLLPLHRRHRRGPRPEGPRVRPGPRPAHPPRLQEEVREGDRGEESCRR